MGEGAEAVQAGVAALEDDMLQKITKPLGAPGPPRTPALMIAARWQGPEPRACSPALMHAALWSLRWPGAGAGSAPRHAAPLVQLQRSRAHPCVLGCQQHAAWRAMAILVAGGVSYPSDSRRAARFQ